MALTNDEKVRIRHHLGYMNVAVLYVYALGIGHSIPHQSVLEGMMDRVVPAAEALLRKHLTRCDETEDQMFDNQDALVVDRIGDIDIRPDGQTQFKNVYLYWRWALANILSVEPNPFDQRFANSPLNVRVHHG